MKIRAHISLLTACATCIMLFSCNLDQNSSSNDYLIRVDSIHAPDTVVSNTAFNVVFFGTIGFDECASFKTFNRTDNGYDIGIEAWGTYNSTPAVCPPALVTLNGQKLSLTFPFPGVYRISILDPGAVTLVKQIVAK